MYWCTGAFTGWKWWGKEERDWCNSREGKSRGFLPEITGFNTLLLLRTPLLCWLSPLLDFAWNYLILASSLCGDLGQKLKGSVQSEFRRILKTELLWFALWTSCTSSHGVQLRPREYTEWWHDECFLCRVSSAPFPATLPGILLAVIKLSLPFRLVFTLHLKMQPLGRERTGLFIQGHTKSQWPSQK